MIRTFHHHNHLPESIIGQLHHEMDMLILLFCELLIGLTLAIDGTCQIITTVTDTFYLRHFAQHGPDLQLTFRT